MKNLEKINYIYLILFFSALMGLCIYYAFSCKDILLESKIYFLVVSSGQYLIEIGAFILVGFFIKRYLPWIFYRVFTGLFFLLFLYHLVDFVLLRLMDRSLGSSLKVFLSSDPTHLLAAFYATNMNLQICLVILIALLATPTIGIFFYELCEKVSRKKPFYFSQKKSFLSVCTLTGFLLFVDLTVLPKIKKREYIQITKALPFGDSMINPVFPTNTFAKVKALENMIGHKNIFTKNNKKPNIYLFIVETFRKDYLNKDITPFLSSFQKECLTTDKSFANANATNLSWFSIFSSSFPYNWKIVESENCTGFNTLKLLKKAGYKLRLYSSADLDYFNMGHQIFGNLYTLCDHSQHFYNTDQTDAWKRDTQSIYSLKTDLLLKENQANTLFIVFLDSPHSEYSYPEYLEGIFGPTEEKINYLSLNLKEDCHKLINRYKTSLFYVDTLFQSFIESLKEQKIYDQSLIVFTGDHGEEFLEEGSLFHGSHLNDAQLKVPLLFKLQNKSNQEPQIVSHIDIFPTLLSHLKIPFPESSFDGQSIEKEIKWPYVLSVQQNGALNPKIFCLSDGKNRLTARFIDKEENNENNIEILSIKHPEDVSILEALKN